MRIDTRRITDCSFSCCVILTSLMWLALACSPSRQPSEHGRFTPPPLALDEVEAVPIIEPRQFPLEERPMLVAVIAELEKQGEDPAEYYASTETDADPSVVIFHLWHKDFFRPENAGLRGNIDGAKGRDMYVDIDSRVVIRTVYWR